MRMNLNAYQPLCGRLPTLAWTAIRIVVDDNPTLAWTTMSIVVDDNSNCRGRHTPPLLISSLFFSLPSSPFFSSFKSQGG
jgi:hypothetical protein